MKKAIIPILGFTALLGIYACNNTDTVAPPTPAPTPVRLAASLSQPTSTTGTSTTATGSFTGSVDPAANVLSYTVTFADVAPTAITMDPISTTNTALTSLTLAAPGSTTGSSTSLTSPHSGNVTVTAAQSAGITGNGYQLNIRSDTQPDGALSGTVTRQP
jgi:hypothetical protein